MEPLPCPFCGKAPRQSFDGFEHRIECDGECPGHAQSHDISPESVLAAWSTRNGIPPAAPTEVPSGGVAGAAEGVRVWVCSYGCCQFMRKTDGELVSRYGRADNALAWGPWIRQTRDKQPQVWEMFRELLGTELAAVIGEVNDASM